MDTHKDLPIVTIITIVSNNVKTIRNAIQSVAFQDYKKIEHIVIDNCSTDGTLEAIEEQKDFISKIISEPDKGIYFALNKGINLSNGEVIGFLNSDDVLKSKATISLIVENLLVKGTDAVYGDLQYFAKRRPNVVSRRWKAGHYSDKKFNQGWMPPHPTFYAYKSIYTEYGFFDEAYEISSDYDMMIRLFYQHKINATYIPKVLVKMQRGGISNQNLSSIIKKTKEDFQIMKRYNFGLSTLLNKTFRKVSQLIFKD